jgi:integrase
MTLARQLSILPELARDDVQGLLARGGLRESTLKRYIHPARLWTFYCQDRGEPPHDASTATLIRWLDWRARGARSPQSTLALSLAAARWVQHAYCTVHELECVPYTTRARVQLEAFLGAATLDTRTKQSARPLRLDDLVVLVARVRGRPHYGRGVTDARARLLAERDAALLVLGWWGALRADDLARLEWPHLRFALQGIELHMPASKTTKASLALAEQPDAPWVCPVHALREYTQGQGWPAEGSVFGLRSGNHVGRRLRDLFVRFGVPRGYTGHSLRAGFATECAAQGVADKLVQAHGRWRSAQQHAEYVRLGRLWEDTPTTRVRVPALAA